MFLTRTMKNVTRCLKGIMGFKLMFPEPTHMFGLNFEQLVKVSV